MRIYILSPLFELQRVFTVEITMIVASKLLLHEKTPDDYINICLFVSVGYNKSNTHFVKGMCQQGMSNCFSD